MSSSVRRLKERGGGGGKITALKSQKSVTENPPPKETIGSCKKPSGKENTRSIAGAGTPSSACRKPAIRPLPMQRIDKGTASAAASSIPVVAKDGDSRFRWSTSMLPKGKSSNPSDFARFLSDLRNDRQSRVSVSEQGGKIIGRASVAESTDLDGENSSNGIRVSQKYPQKKPFVSLKPRSGEEKLHNGGLAVSEKPKPKYSCLNSKESANNALTVFDDLVLNMEKICDKEINGVIENCKEKPSLGSCFKGNDGAKEVKKKGTLESHSKSLGGEKGLNISKIVENSQCTSHDDPTFKVDGERTSNGFGALENLEELKVADEDGKNVRAVNKYPSRLHEKLAYLEGKVKRIASDIKRTKEMLDQNNTDASKLILSDIQEKISGIEKAMGHMIEDKGKLSLVESVENEKLQPKHAERKLERQKGIFKNSVKQLNHEELEARLFPHHKLLRNRVSLGNSIGNDQSSVPNSSKSNGDSSVDDKPLSPIEENPIALEFLASLTTGQSEIHPNNRFVSSECSAVRATDTEGNATSATQDASWKVDGRKCDEDVELTTDEVFEDFDDQENKPRMIIQEEIEDNSVDQLKEIGSKSSTGGWFVSEGESVLLVHDDGSCSFYDITNSEEKSEYKPPAGVSRNLWGDCWLVRTAGSDGCSGRYVVAASAGNTLDSGFCSWDFYTKEIQAFHVEDGRSTMVPSRTVLGPLPNTGLHRRSASPAIRTPESQQWWYRPCGPLIVSTASSQKMISIYDIRDGDLIMKWEVPKTVLMMEYSSPLQWRNRGKVVIAETDAIRLWDVNSLNPQRLLSIESSCKKITALHVNNTDAELGGGVRQRVSSSEAEGNDGVFCTHETTNVLDFRLPSGLALKMAKHGSNTQSIFSRGDSIFLGSTELKSTSKDETRSLVQQFSLRKGKLVTNYVLPKSSAHFHHTSITQVWGNSNLVMGTCGLGLFVFDAQKDDGLQLFSADHGNAGEVREIIGPDDLYNPSFDYLGSRVLLISRDRPALWRYLM